MEMYDEQVIAYRGRPLFQTAKVASPSEADNTLEDIACFFYVLNGCGKLVEGHGEHGINQREGLVKSCGNFISRYLKDQEGNDFEAMVIFFYPDIIQEIYKDELPNIIHAVETTSRPRQVIGNAQIEKFMKGMIDYFENAEIMDEELMRLKLKELIMILLKSNYFENVLDFFRGLFTSRKSNLREIIENNLYNDLSLDQLAFLTNRSLSTFKRDFKKEFEESPAKYIKRQRLEKAANQLLITDEAVSAIAYDCGFQDISTFSDSFRTHFGVAPTQYRVSQTRN